MIVLRLSYAAYLASEADAPHKREYWDGFLVGMAGGSVRHSALGGRIVSELARRLGAGNPCREFNSDLRIRVEALNASFYPDASVICGKVQTASDDANAAVNPTLLVEVVSPSTESYDRGAKFQAYSRLESLRGYLLLDATTGLLELYERGDDPDRWTKTEIARGEAAMLPLESLGITLDVARLFEGIDDLP